MMETRKVILEDLDPLITSHSYNSGKGGRQSKIRCVTNRNERMFVSIVVLLVVKLLVVNVEENWKKLDKRNRRDN